MNTILCDDLILCIYDFMSIQDLRLCSKSHWERFMEQDQLFKNLHISNTNLEDLKRQYSVIKDRYLQIKSKPPIPSFFFTFRDVDKYHETKSQFVEELADYMSMLNRLNSKINRARSRVFKIINSLQYRRHTSKKQCHTDSNSGLGIQYPPPCLYIT